MHKFTNTLTPTQVYRFAVDFCQPHLGFRTIGKVTAEVFLTVLFAAAARISSVSETCRRLSNVPYEDTFSRSLRQLVRARRTQTLDQRGLRGTSGATQKYTIADRDLPC
jgi:hypothetical protein